jgi:hypothetical protein
MFKLETADSIKKQIVGIGRAGVRLVAAIQVAAVQVIGHAVKHGDITLAQSLCENVPKHHKAVLVAFLEKFGPFKFDADKKALVFYRDNSELKLASINVPGGELTQEYVDKLPKWESAKKPQEVKSMYDVEAEASRFLERMRKQTSSGVEVKHRKLLDVLMVAYNRYVAALSIDETNISPEMDAGTPEGQAELTKLADLKAA